MTQDGKYTAQYRLSWRIATWTACGAIIVTAFFLPAPAGPLFFAAGGGIAFCVALPWEEYVGSYEVGGDRTQLECVVCGVPAERDDRTGEITCRTT